MNMNKKPSLKQWWALVKGAASAWSDDYAPSVSHRQRSLISAEVVE
jgi:hypothetical protein